MATVPICEIEPQKLLQKITVLQVGADTIDLMKKRN